jgi:hypothetical protein
MEEKLCLVMPAMFFTGIASVLYDQSWKGHRWDENLSVVIQYVGTINLVAGTLLALAWMIALIIDYCQPAQRKYRRLQARRRLYRNLLRDGYSEEEAEAVANEFR